MSASSIADWLSCLQEAWRRHNGTKWLCLVFGLCISGVGFTVGVRGVKTGYISWELAGVFLGISGICIAIFFFVKIFFKNNRTIRLRRRRQARNWTSPSRSSLCQYHNAGLYTSTADDLPSESHDLCQLGRCLHSTEDIPRSTEEAEEYLELETHEHLPVENRSYHDDALRSVESDGS